MNPVIYTLAAPTELHHRLYKQFRRLIISFKETFIHSTAQESFNVSTNNVSNGQLSRSPSSCTTTTTGGGGQNSGHSMSLNVPSIGSNNNMSIVNISNNPINGIRKTLLVKSSQGQQVHTNVTGKVSFSFSTDDDELTNGNCEGNLNEQHQLQQQQEEDDDDDDGETFHQFFSSTNSIKDNDFTYPHSILNVPIVINSPETSNIQVNYVDNNTSNGLNVFSSKSGNNSQQTDDDEREKNISIVIESASSSTSTSKEKIKMIQNLCDNLHDECSNLGYSNFNTNSNLKNVDNLNNITKSENGESKIDHHLSKLIIDQKLNEEKKYLNEQNTTKLTQIIQIDDSMNNVNEENTLLTFKQSEKSNIEYSSTTSTSNSSSRNKSTSITNAMSKVLNVLTNSNKEKLISTHSNDSNDSGQSHSSNTLLLNSMSNIHTSSLATDSSTNFNVNCYQLPLQYQQTRHNSIAVPSANFIDPSSMKKSEELFSRRSSQGSHHRRNLFKSTLNSHRKINESSSLVESKYSLLIPSTSVSSQESQFSNESISCLNGNLVDDKSIVEKKSIFQSVKSDVNVNDNDEVKNFSSKSDLNENSIQLDMRAQVDKYHEDIEF